MRGRICVSLLLALVSRAVRVKRRFASDYGTHASRIRHPDAEDPITNQRPRRGRDSLIETGVSSDEGRTSAEAWLVGLTLGPFQLERQLDVVPLAQERLAEMTEVGGDASAAALLETRSGMHRVVPVQKNIRSGWQLNKFLGRGGFGATYLATPTEDFGLAKKGEQVAIKFIYSFEDNEIRLATGNDEDYEKHLRELAQECADLQKLQEGASKNPTGALRIVRCLAACVPDSYECDTDDTDPQFIVMDYAGEDGDNWLEANWENKTAVANVLQNVVEGVDYLSQALDPPIIHHDLKWGNVAVKRNSSGDWQAILIDFGAVETFQGRSKDQFGAVPGHGKSAVATPGYCPPEWDLGFTYKSPAHSFDMYSVGAMALEGLCDVPYTGLKKLGKVSSEDRLPSPQVFNDMLGKLGKRAGKACRQSMAGIMHPNPAMRTAPSSVVFDESGIRSDSHSPKPMRKDNSDSFMNNLRNVLTPPEISETDLNYAGSDNETCAFAWVGFRHKDMEVSRVKKALKSLRDGYPQRTNASRAAMTNVKTVIKHLQRAITKGSWLSPLHISSHRHFCICSLTYAVRKHHEHSNQKKTDVKEDVEALMSLLLWSELWVKFRERKPRNNAESFVHSLFFGRGEPHNFRASLSGAEKFEKRTIGLALERINEAAQNLFDASGGREAILSNTKNKMMSTVKSATWMHYRQLYRHLYYLFCERLQASSVYVACALHGITSRIISWAVALFEKTHVHSVLISKALLNKLPDYRDAKDRLPFIKESIEALNLLFLEDFSGDLPQLDVSRFSEFDEFSNWFNDSFFGHTGDFAVGRMKTRPKGNEDFKKKIHSTCPRNATDSLPVELPPWGAYSMLVQVVDNIKEIAMSGLRGVVRESADDPKHKYKLGRLLSKDLKDAGKRLADFATSNSDEKFADEAQNIASFELRLINRLYRSSDDVHFDDTGLSHHMKRQQPGLVYQVKQLVTALGDLSIHPAQL